ncbi:MAG: energy transducer TonB [Deltaproteobacteria bacterium]|jgi:protein TonB|nr:energy transducer TonB [Deltaproteobacteria bacterium]
MTSSSWPDEGLYSRAFILSTLAHVLALFVMIAINEADFSPPYAPLASMDFSPYDPLGGEPGNEAAELNEPKTPPEPEPEDPEIIPSLVESVAEAAAPYVPPPPPEKPKPKKPKIPRGASPGPVNPDPGPPGPGRGGAGGGAGQGNPDLLGAYKGQISRRLNQFKKFPPAAMAKGLTGVAKVSFRINANGRVSMARLSASSGVPVLDDEALALLRRCSPFPPIPPALGLNVLELSVPISFTKKG